MDNTLLQYGHKKPQGQELLNGRDQAREREKTLEKRNSCKIRASRRGDKIYFHKRGYRRAIRWPHSFFFNALLQARKIKQSRLHSRKPDGSPCLLFFAYFCVSSLYFSNRYATRSASSLNLRPYAFSTAASSLRWAATSSGGMVSGS